MNLLRFLLQAGGEGFRAVEFSSAALGAGIPTGTVVHIRKPQCGLARDSGLPGTGGDAFLLWRSAKVDYAISRQQYRAQQVFGAPEFLQSWKREEEAILHYLGGMAERLPRVSDYCDGDSFLLLKLIYGEEEEGGAGTTGGGCIRPPSCRCWPAWVRGWRRTRNWWTSISPAWNRGRPLAPPLGDNPPVKRARPPLVHVPKGRTGGTSGLHRTA